MFLVYYLDWTDSWTPSYINLFVTADEELAKKYVDKFNTIRKKWTEYFKEQDDKNDYDDDSDEVYAIYERFLAWEKVGECSYTEIKLR